MRKNIRIATYNIAHCLNFSTYQPPQIPSRDLVVEPQETAKVVHGLDATIVGLNEVYETGGNGLSEQAKTIAKAAGMKYSAFGEAICFDGDIPASYGNALLSDKKIVFSDVIKVPVPTKDERREGENGYYEDRAVLRAEIDVDGTNITVFVTHFGLNLLEQERMVATLVKIIDEVKTHVVLMGDFNVTPHSPVLQPIYDRLQSAADAVGSTAYTFSSYAPDRTIDYIFVSKEFAVSSFDVVDNRTSDHRPCVATLHLK